jgi:hypothetical protein
VTYTSHWCQKFSDFGGLLDLRVHRVVNLPFCENGEHGKNDAANTSTDKRQPDQNGEILRENGRDYGMSNETLDDGQVEYPSRNDG